MFPKFPKSTLHNGLGCLVAVYSLIRMLIAHYVWHCQ